MSRVTGPRFGVLLALCAALWGCVPADKGGDGADKAPAAVNCAEQCPCECKCEEAVAQKGDPVEAPPVEAPPVEEIAEDQLPSDQSDEPYPVVLVGNIKVVEGKLDENEARKRVSAKRLSLRECYAPLLKADKNVRGELEAQFTVSSGTGKIIAAVVRESTLDDKTLQRCVTDKLKEIRFEPYKDTTKESVVRLSAVMVGVNL